MRPAKTCVLLLSIMLLISAPMLVGQTATGEINGTLTDPSGAVISGATLKLTNQSTQIQTQSTSNATGFFIFVGVRPGTYSLRVEKQGFRSVDVSQLQLGVNQALTQNLQIPVGAVSESVQVTGEAPLVDNSTTELGTVIETKVVNDLPLNGRNFTQLLTLTPGVTPVGTSQNTAGCCEGN